MVTYLESDLQVIPGTGTWHRRVRRQRVRLIDNRTTQFAVEENEEEEGGGGE